MNIFVLDENPEKAAQMQVDSHVIKMVLESGQLLSTAHRVLDGSKNPITKKWVLPDVRDSLLYSATHINHPCAVWVRESLGNYDWLYRHFIALGKEYTVRYGKVHKSILKLENDLQHPPYELYCFESGSPDLTPFALAMPDEYKVSGNAVQSYRNYYKDGKKHLHKYTNREIPEWML